ncbi:L-asparagine oxygenase [Actinoplanes sp. OR16]|uniref:TauD/TfdA family dioxygenase n=1 Tax=Actinoplanes sp. OR16 TaxID=946334 RepID=UPI000F6E0906|nr:TauD/TfdA family dioxygenase [Actinoplanes sp. OR16]BBH67856.1 L-asparagine oxygenase [Actinoplanes sp. OR16]
MITGTSTVNDPDIADVATPQAAALLADTAHRLAAAGAVADTVFPRHLTALPAPLHAALEEVLRPPERTCGRRLIRGLLAGFAEPGPTPQRWQDANTADTRALDIALVLLSTSLGRIFGWAGQQDGRLVHNILPTEGYEEVQVGASSTAELTWHTEDAFHPDRAHLLMLACMRNPDDVGSRLASVRRAEISPTQRELLQRPLLSILPDDSYPQDWMDAANAGMATLWPAPDGMCLRYDPAYTLFHDDGETFRSAHRRLGDALDDCAEEVPLRFGDIVLVDNDIVVHGRGSFRPRYDGSDRWLKRTLIHLPRRRAGSEAHESGYGQELIEPQVPA